MISHHFASGDDQTVTHTSAPTRRVHTLNTRPQPLQSPECSRHSGAHDGIEGESLISLGHQVAISEANTAPAHKRLSLSPLDHDPNSTRCVRLRSWYRARPLAWEVGQEAASSACLTGVPLELSRTFAAEAEAGSPCLPHKGNAMAFGAQNSGGG
jgi:hypothetical protein